MKIMPLRLAQANRIHTSCAGSILLETMTALAIVGILVFALVKTQQQTQRFNAVQLARMRCIAAAQAELDSIAATGRGITESRCAQLWPGIRLAVEKSPGQGQWTGLTLLKVTAVGSAKGPPATVELTRYVPARQEQ